MRTRARRDASYYRELAKLRGFLFAARDMRAAGWSMAQCRWTLCSKEEYPVLSKVVYRGSFWNLYNTGVPT